MSQNKILIDGVIFQLQKGRPSGISRVWHSLLTEIAKTPLAQQIILLDRNNTAPAINGIQTRPMFAYDQLDFEADSLYLQDMMDAERASVFFSTYYTYPETGPSVLMLHDMTPEVMGFDLSHPEWRAKAKAIEHADFYLSVSHSTKNDFQKIYPQFRQRPVFVIPNAVSESFQRASDEDVAVFKKMYGIKKPYFLVSGQRGGYKNAILFFRALSMLPHKTEYEVLCTGGALKLEKALEPFLDGIKVQIRFLSDKELTAAYSGAVALVYPSLYEGFGLPIIEALKVGCPIITCRNSSIPEASGDNVLYVGGFDVEGMITVLQEIQKEEMRRQLIVNGKNYVQQFSWKTSAELLNNAIPSIMQQLPSLPIKTSEPITTGSRFLYTLTKMTSNKSLISSLAKTKMLLKNGKMALDFSDIQKDEKIIKSAMDTALYQKLQKYCREFSVDGVMRYWYGLMLEKHGELAQATQQYLDAIKLGEGYTRIYYLAAMQSIALGNMVTAEKLLDNLCGAIPHSAELNHAKEQVAKELALVKEEMKLTAISPFNISVPVIRSLPNEPRIDVSVVLPTKDRPEELAATLASLAESMKGLRYEVLLYVGGKKTPELEEVLKKYPTDKIFYDSDVFAPGVKFSWSILMNHGFNTAQGTWIMFASDDIVFHPLAFTHAVMLGEQDGTIGGVTFLHRNTVEDYGGIFKEYGYDTVAKKIFINFGIIRKSAFEKTKGFDTKYKFYWADVDICLQVWEQGYSIVPSPYSLVEHNNIVDKIRSDNSGDLYFADTKYYAQKWSASPMLNPKKILSKERFVLTPSIVQDIHLYNTTKKQSDMAASSNGIVVSAIISTYNSEKFIKGCLDDLINQTLYQQNKLEIIVVNSGSQQNEEAVVKEYQLKNKNIQYVRTERESIYAAWNRGVRMATGKYITNANTDDRHSQTALEQMAQVMEQNSNVDLVYADCFMTTVMNDTIDSITPKKIIHWSDYHADTLLFACYMGPQPLWKKSLHDRFGYFDDTLQIAGDYEFWLRISREATMYHLPQPLGLYYYSSQSAERKNTDLASKETKHIQEKYFDAFVTSAQQLSLLYHYLETIKPTMEEEACQFLNDLLKKREAVISNNHDENALSKQITETLQHAGTLTQEGKWNEAITILLSLKEAIQDIPHERLKAGVHNLLGRCYLAMDDLEKAKTEFENALQRDHNSSESCAGLGEVFYRANLTNEAKTMFEWAVKLKPENEMYEKQLAEINRTLGFADHHSTLEETMVEQ